MESRPSVSARIQSDPTPWRRRKKSSSSWRSILGLRKPRESWPDTPYVQSVANQDSPGRPSATSYSLSFELPRRPPRPSRHAVSRLTWSRFTRKDVVDSDAHLPSAREVYHETATRGLWAASSQLRRPETADSHHHKLVVNPAPTHSRDGSSLKYDVESHAHPRSMMPEPFPEAIFTLAQQPDPKERITVQYSPTARPGETQLEPQARGLNISPIRDLADHDPDKRNKVFGRIHLKGWNQVIPKQWVEDEFSDDGTRSMASQSIYPDEFEAPQVPEQQPSVESGTTGRGCWTSQVPISKSAQTPNPRFVFEENEDSIKAGSCRASEASGDDQVWWRQHIDLLPLISIPYHEHRECSSSRIPRPIKTVSLLRETQRDIVSPQRSEYHGPHDASSRQIHERGNGRGLKADETKTYKAQSIISPKGPARRRTVEQFFDIIDSSRLVLAPLQPRKHGMYQVKAVESWKRRPSQVSHASVSRPQNSHILPQGSGRLPRNANSPCPSSDASWETLRCMGDGEVFVGGDNMEVPELLHLPLTSPNVELERPARLLAKRDGKITESSGGLEQTYDEVLDLCFADQRQSSSSSASQTLQQRQCDITNLTLETTDSASFPWMQHHNYRRPTQNPQSRPSSMQAKHARSSTPCRDQKRKSSWLRREALFQGDYPQSPSCEIRRDNPGRGMRNPAVRLPVTVLDEFGNVWI